MVAVVVVVGVDEGQIVASHHAAAHAHAVGFIELPVAAAVIALQEGFLHPFYRQIQAPVLPVDGDIHIAAQRGVHSKIAHHLVGTLSTLVVA